MAETTTICNLLLTLGISLGGECVPPKADFDLPPDEEKAWAYEAQPEQEITPPPPVQDDAEMARLRAEIAKLYDLLNRPDFPAVIIKEKVEIHPPKVEEAVVEQPAPEQIDPAALEREAIHAWLANAPPLRPTAVALSSGPDAGASADLEDWGPGAGFSSGGGVDNLARTVPEQEYDYPRKFSSLPVDNSRIFTVDRVITGLVETSVNSQLGSEDGGEIIIQTKYDVFGYHGRNILVPMGSRLVCTYNTAEIGETRLGIICKRVLFGGNRAEIISLQTLAGDQQGGGGVPGEVNNRFLEKYGTAFWLTAISATYRGSTAFTGSENGQAQSSAEQALDASSQELSQRLGEISAAVIEENVNLKPVISLDQGDIVQLRPRNDWYIRKVDDS